MKLNTEKYIKSSQAILCFNNLVHNNISGTKHPLLLFDPRNEKLIIWEIKNTVVKKKRAFCNKWKDAVTEKQTEDVHYNTPAVQVLTDFSQSVNVIETRNQQYNVICIS